MSMYMGISDGGGQVESRETTAAALQKVQAVSRMDRVAGGQKQKKIEASQMDLVFLQNLVLNSSLTDLCRQI